MLAKRIIIQLCFDEGVLTRTKRFVPDYRYTQAFSWSENADEIVLVDVSTKRDDSIFLSLVEKYCRDSGLPMTVANHIASADDAAPLFDRGADRVLVSYIRRHCYEEIAGRWGSNALVAGVDYHSSQQGDILGHASFQALQYEAPGEFLLTDIDRDGSLLGYDLSTLRACCAATATPIIVSGGCGNVNHIQEAFIAGAQGACTSVIHHLSDTSMRGWKRHLTAMCVNVRPIV